jgi:hypothetical protein
VEVIKTTVGHDQHHISFLTRTTDASKESVFSEKSGPQAPFRRSETNCSAEKRSDTGIFSTMAGSRIIITSPSSKGTGILLAERCSGGWSCFSVQIPPPDVDGDISLLQPERSLYGRGMMGEIVHHHDPSFFAEYLLTPFNTFKGFQPSKDALEVPPKACAKTTAERQFEIL